MKTSTTYKLAIRTNQTSKNKLPRVGGDVRGTSKSERGKKAGTPPRETRRQKKKLKNGRLVNNSSNRSDFDISARIKYLTSNFFSFLSPWR